MNTLESLSPKWVNCSLGEVVQVLRGVSYSKSQSATVAKPSFVPILRATNINRVLDFEELVYVEPACVDSEQFLREGDIVVAASSGSKSVVGKAAHFTGGWRGSFGAFCMGLRPNTAVDSRFVGYFLQTDEYRHQISELSAGSNINNLKRDHILSFPFRIGPLPEQRRIVAKIEELLSDLDAGVAALQRAKTNLKRYRASVLKAAVEGKLTEAWRSEHSNAEPASKLLERILTERRKKWEADQLTKFKTAGKEPPKNWQARYVEPKPPVTAGLPELPEGWCWASVEQVASECTVGHVGPMKDEYESDGIPFLRSQNVRPLRFDRVGLRFIPKGFHEKLRKSRLIGGELLVVRSGNIGEACVYPFDEPEANCADLVITRFTSGFDAHYASIFIVSPLGKYLVGGKRTGSALSHFNVGAMEQSPIPLPPLPIQKRIVEEVAERLSQIEASELAIENGLRRAARLRQSILKLAFEGKLVPQDPADEPAGELLARVKALQSIPNRDNPTLNGLKTGQPRRRRKVK